ncbi:MAG: polysaccharide export protein [Acidobacteriaceae bacterium]|nr:polysaccharide export protein [Acidobacteriaceae bacterium]
MISRPAPPTEFQKVVAASAGKMLPIYGAGLFTARPSTFAPVSNIPVTADYAIGPGDELRIQIWGQVSQHGTFVVDRTGAISMPTVGAIHVAGVPYSHLSDFLKTQIARVYRNFDLNVNLGQLRSIQVFVVGQVKQPGSYTISSLSTLVNALFVSGGPLPQGTLRDIQVRRNGETISHFDLYDLLLHGDKSKDVRLQAGDVIFVPAAGPQVAVLGSVNTPGIYELRAEKSFHQLMELAGGESSTASDAHLRVERIYNHSERSEIEIDLANDNSANAQDGDIVNVTSILGRFQNTVTLRGNVANPGRYVWHQGMHVSDLIPNREALVTRSYYQRLNKLGQVQSEYDEPVPVAGGVRASSASNLSTNGLSSGLTSENASSASNYEGTRQEGALGLGAAAAESAANRNQQDSTSGGGNSSIGSMLTANSNTFEAKTDVVLNAPDIDWGYAVIERQNAADLTTSLEPFNLGKAVIDKDPAQDLELLSGDVVTIFSQADIHGPSSQQTKFVKLEGEFFSAGIYSVRPGETLRQLVRRAGGLTPDAYLFGSEFTRESVRRLQRQRILEYADTLESQVSANTSAAAASSISAADAAAAEASAKAAQSAVAHLRQARPSGRIVLELKPDSKDVDSLPNIELEDGDQFIVSKTPAIVAVQGQVYSANSFIYKKGKRVKDYVFLAGGPDRMADHKREYILRADGSVLSYQYGDREKHSIFVSNKFDEQTVLAGDTIVVPPVLMQGSLMRDILNISTVVQGFGLGVAAINVLQ